MNSNFKKIEQNKYELSVELGRDELAQYVSKTEDRVAAEVKIDGFRPGKAPKNKVREQVGEQYILEKALDAALQESLSKALDEHEVEAIKVTDLNIKENSASRLAYSVKVSVFPHMELPDLKDIKVIKKEIEVEKKEIDEALEFIRSSRSKFLDKDGEVAKGDRVEIDFEVTSEGLPVEGGVSKSHPLVVGDNKFIPGFEDQLIGMKKGEEKKFTLKAPDDYFHKSVAGRMLDFSVKVVNTQNIEKPEMNDDFARTLGRFTNLKDLEDNIRAGILEEKKVKEKNRLRLEILANVFEKSKVDLPGDMIEERLDAMVAGFDSDLHAKGMELSFYLAHLGKTQDDLRNDWRKEAEKQAAYALILRKLAKLKNIRPSSEEIDNEVNKTVQMMALKGDLSRENMDIDGLRESIASDMINEKVFAFLEENCLA